MIYAIHCNFDFDIVNFPFFDDDVPRCASYMGYTFCNSLGLLASAIMLRTLMREINV